MKDCLLNVDELLSTVESLVEDLDNKSEITLSNTHNGYILSRFVSGMGSGHRVHQLYGLSESEMLFVIRDYLKAMRGRH